MCTPPVPECAIACRRKGGRERVEAEERLRRQAPLQGESSGKGCELCRNHWYLPHVARTHIVKCWKIWRPQMLLRATLPHCPVETAAQTSRGGEPEMGLYWVSGKPFETDWFSYSISNSIWFGGTEIWAAVSAGQWISSFRARSSERARGEGGGGTGPARLAVRHEVNEARRRTVLAGCGVTHAKLEQRHTQLGRGADLERPCDDSSSSGGGGRGGSNSGGSSGGSSSSDGGSSIGGGGSSSSSSSGGGSSSGSDSGSGRRRRRQQASSRTQARQISVCPAANRSQGGLPSLTSTASPASCLAGAKRAQSRAARGHPQQSERKQPGAEDKERSVPGTDRRVVLEIAARSPAAARMSSGST